MTTDFYHYRECGLDYVYLANGFHFAKTESGDDVVIIDDVEGLHRAIRQFVIDLPRPLHAREFRYLRKAIDVSQRYLAATAGVDEQTISMWERGLSPIQRSVEMYLRAWVREHDSDRPAIRELTERFNALDREIYDQEKRLNFTRSGSAWIQKAAA